MNKLLVFVIVDYQDRFGLYASQKGQFGINQQSKIFGSTSDESCPFL
jgi:hypothetical protein